MIIKKFQGKTEEEATKAAREEMGSSVVIMNAKLVKQKGIFAVFKKPFYEVTAAIEENVERSVKPENIPNNDNTQSVKNNSALGGSLDIIVDEKTEEKEDNLKKVSNDNSGRNIEAQLENLSTLIEQQILKKDEPKKHSEDVIEKSSDQVVFLKLIYNTLIDNEVDEHYINDLLDDLEGSSRPGAAVDSLLPDIYQRLILKFGQSEGIAKAKTGAKVVFFIGPTGVGKTTTVAKLASKLSVVDGKKIAMLTTDTYRIAATDQLKTYASILDVPFRIVYTADEIISAYEEYSSYDYILVDTAGHSPNNESQFLGTKDYINALEDKCEIENYLVLSVTTKYRDLIKISDLYSTICRYKLIFTKLDETDCYGNILNIKLHTKSAMSYVTMGQNVPDDIELFKPQSIVRGLLEKN